MRFWAFGPFDAHPDKQDEFWRQAAKVEVFDDMEDGSLKGAIGCYVFVMQRGKTLVPWYVGKTNARTGFQREIFTPHKQQHYWSAIEAKPTYKPKMLLFPLITSTERLSRAYSTHRSLIEWMERTLIGMALSKNTELLNARDTKNLRYCIVDGVFGAEGHAADYDSALAARRALTDLDVE